MVGEFTKCSGCFTIDNGIFFQNFSSDGLAVKLTVSPVVHFDFYSGDRHRSDAHEYQCPGSGLLKFALTPRAHANSLINTRLLCPLLHAH